LAGYLVSFADHFYVTYWLQGEVKRAGVFAVTQLPYKFSITESTTDTVKEAYCEVNKKKREKILCIQQSGF
jgi:hypothetical protein